MDGESVADFEKDLKGNLYRIWNRMSSGTYFPPPVRAVEIAKAHGTGTRILGVPTVADRVAQRWPRSRLAGDWSCDCAWYDLVFAGFRFPREVISVAVRWYLRYGLSCRDAEELLAERGVTVDLVSVYRWVQRFTCEFIQAVRPCRHAPGDRWFVDAGHLSEDRRKVGLCLPGGRSAWPGHRRTGVSETRPEGAARRFSGALRTGTIPAEVTTDRAAVYPRVIDELIPSALHTVEQYANNPVEADHGRLKAWLRPMRGEPPTVSADPRPSHAFVQNLRRGHYDIAMDVPPATGSASPSTTSQLPSDPRRIQVIMP